jgi:hypothetical protein
MQIDVVDRANTTSATKRRSIAVPSPWPVKPSSATNRSTPAVPGAIPDELGVLGVVGDQVGLDEPDRLLVEKRDVEIRRLVADDRREVVVDDALVRPAVTPPPLNVRPL